MTGESVAAAARSGPRGWSIQAKLLAGVVGCLSLAALVSYLLCDRWVVGHFLNAAIDNKDTRLLAIGKLGKPWTPIWLLLLWSWAAKRPRVLLAGMLAMALVPAVVLPIKTLTGRIRPDDLLEGAEQLLRDPLLLRSYSFPSGDTALAFAAAAAVAGSIAAAHLRWIPFVPAGLVGLTRLCLLRHYASDALAGAAVGILCGYAALRISRGWLSRAPPGWRATSGIAVVLFLAVDALARGPVLRHFLPVFGPAIVFVLLATKAPAWLQRAAHADALRIAGGAIVAAAILAMPLAMLPGGDGWPWFLQASAVALVGGCGAARAFRRGRRAAAVARLAAVALLVIGLIWQLDFPRLAGAKRGRNEASGAARAGSGEVHGAVEGPHIR